MQNANLTNVNLLAETMGQNLNQKAIIKMPPNLYVLNLMENYILVPNSIKEIFIYNNYKLVQT